MKRFSGQTVLITGGSRGIGRACGLAFAREGANLAVNYQTNEAEASKTALTAKEIGVEATTFRADTSNATEVREMMTKVVSTFGRIDVLVNNAGILRRTPFLQIPESEWDLVLNTNLKGYFLVGQGVSRHMVDLKIKGSIINISSNAQELPGRNLAHYDVSKAGVAMLTKCMALELAPYGIRVNAVSPGLIETDMNRKNIADRIYREKRMERIPLGLIGTPEDVAGAVLFLASEEAKLATGHTIFLDAGANIS